VCARGSNRALLRGPSTSPLERIAGDLVVTDDPHRLALQYERLVANRALLMGAHVVLASAVAAAYLSRLYFPHLPFMGGVGGTSVVAALVPPLLPYLISGIHSRSFVTPKRPKLLVFIVFLIVSTTLVTSLLLGHFGSLGWEALLAVFVGQTVAYVWGANILFGNYDAL
jgi:hypothetical protein